MATPASRRSRASVAPVACGLIAMLVLASVLTGCSAASTSRSPFVTGAVPAEQSSAPSGDAQAGAPAPRSDPEPATVTAVSATVVRVVDGDTARFRLPDGTEESVRFIGVNTPESTTRIEVFGKEASAYTHRMLPAGTVVHLEKDVEERDRYGRLLAYVWLSPPGAVSDAQIRSKMLNARLALDGYAQQMTIPPNVKYADYFTKYVAEARAADRGLWNPAVTAAPKPKPAPPPKPAAEPAPAPKAAAYIGNRNTHKFHYADCSSVSQMNPANRVPYSSRAAAIADGYVPCKRCKP